MKFIFKILQKCNDLGIVYVPYVIGSTTFDNEMLDLVASIDVMPSLVFNSLSLGLHKTTNVVI